MGAFKVMAGETGSGECVEQFEKQFEQQFERRKVDHIRLALDEKNQAHGGSGLDRIRLRHEAFPEINFNDVVLATEVFGAKLKSPIFISSMTAGHAGSQNLNLIMAKVAETRGWAMGVGSQRRQLTDSSADLEWKAIRKECPRVVFFGNIGLSQLISTPTSDVQRLADTLEASAMIVHTNPLQECLQPEGTPQFAGGLKAVEKLCRELSVPVILKETGCGFSRETLSRLRSLGVAAVDVSGFGGTHWGRVEGGRSQAGEKLNLAAETFKDWGVSTLESLLYALEFQKDYQVWASGGVRSGLDAAIVLAIGAKMVGVAKPIMQAALQGENALMKQMELLEFELKTALFCTGSKNLHELREKKVWRWKKT